MAARRQLPAPAIVFPCWEPDVGIWLAWAPLATAMAHMFEEFVLPGGFMSWYSRYRGSEATSVNPRFLVIINFVLLAVCFKTRCTEI
jgi:hypothetical protein